MMITYREACCTLRADDRCSFSSLHIFGRKKGRLNDALSYNIRDREEAIGFLYGRIYDYLSTTGKELFRAVSVLVKEQVLTNVIGKLRYILNLDADRSRF